MPRKKQSIKQHLFEVLYYERNSVVMSHNRLVVTASNRQEAEEVINDFKKERQQEQCTQIRSYFRGSKTLSPTKAAITWSI